VIFVNETSVDRVMSMKNVHCIMGKWVDCKRAMSKESLHLKENNLGGNPIINSKYLISSQKENTCTNCYLNSKCTNNFPEVNNNNSNSNYYPKQQYINNYQRPSNDQKTNPHYVVNNYCKYKYINFLDINQTPTPQVNYQNYQPVPESYQNKFHPFNNQSNNNNANNNLKNHNNFNYKNNQNYNNPHFQSYSNGEGNSRNNNPINHFTSNYYINNANDPKKINLCKQYGSSTDVNTKYDNCSGNNSDAGNSDSTDPSIHRYEANDCEFNAFDSKLNFTPINCHRRIPSPTSMQFSLRSLPSIFSSNKPSIYNYFQYKLFDFHGEDLTRWSNLSYYENNKRIKLFREDSPKLFANDDGHDRSNNNNSSSIEKQVDLDDYNEYDGLGVDVNNNNNTPNVSNEKEDCHGPHKSKLGKKDSYFKPY
jgi:hypothetical protein